VYEESKLFLNCLGWHFFTAMSVIKISFLSVKNVSYKKREFGRFILFFGKTKYRLQTFDTRDYNMLAMHALCNIICGQKLTFFWLNFSGKDFKSLEASYLPVAFAAGMTIESIKLCCFRIVVLFQKISSPLSWKVFWFDTSPLSISLEIPVSVHTLLLKI